MPPFWLLYGEITKRKLLSIFVAWAFQDPEQFGGSGGGNWLDRKSVGYPEEVEAALELAT
ncbi:hypothetical protein [Alkalinema sp. FACHB-956]|uniref:hypothetical protein n=1 Tax=Alkalinema sp. FACHB-956 TaxID=2692768 RepID=UPI001689CD3A|nr:hypothetical protein [Alkalinema sp. FACHB-956]MBD2327098.1 hypothetical protein [Alkalinema sp. FACHB-956]